MVYPQLRLYIGGKWLDCGPKYDSQTSSDVINPANEEVLGHLPHASDAMIAKAIAAADSGLVRWRSESAIQRRRILLRAASIIATRKDVMCRVLSLEQGKTLSEASAEIDRTIETFEWFGEEATRIHGRIYSQRVPGVRNMVVSEPVGIVAAFTPWNFPALLPARKIAPALAAGCSVILKSAEETPGTAILLIEALEEAGLPPGTINLLVGMPAHISKQLLASPAIRKVSFTGSARVGKLLARLAAENLQRCTLELGGHAPVIVFSDANVADTVKAVSAFKFRNAGQVCISPSRFYVHRRIYDAFVDCFAASANQVIVGDGGNEKSTMGPLANRRRAEAMTKFVGDAISKGSCVAAGGKPIGSCGYFWEPTILADVPDSALVMREEPFGPIAPIAPFSEIDDVLLRANGLGYGLAAYVYTGSPDVARLMAEKLEVGTVGINHLSPAYPDIPLGGVKESGYGYEGGHEGLDAYLVHKHVAHTFL